MKDQMQNMSQGHHEPSGTTGHKHEGGNHPSVSREQHEQQMQAANHPADVKPTAMAQAAMGAQAEMMRMMQG